MVIVRIYRVLDLIFVVSLFLIRSFFIHLTTTDPHLRRRRFALNVQRASKGALKAFNIEVEVNNAPSNGKRFLIVSNHLGFIDIFAIASSVPTLFVTSVEMKETPVLGLITEMGACMYVERRSRTNLHNEIKEIEAALNDGFNVVVFPEGRSTNGEKVLPFKKSLLMACSSSEANVMPVVINFNFINGEPMNGKFRDWVCWYDDLPFAAAVWNASQINQCKMSLSFLNEVHVNGDSNHRDIADHAQRQVEMAFHPIL